MDGIGRFNAWGLVLALLAALVAINGAWAALGRLTGPLLGAAGYCAVLLVAARRQDFRAPLIGGAVGTALHVVELSLRSHEAWLGTDVFLVLNASVSAALGALCVWALRTRYRPRLDARVGRGERGDCDESEDRGAPGSADD